MPSPDRGCLRVVRACAIAFCVVVLSLVAHVLAGGSAPGPTTLLITAAVVAGYAGLLTRDRLSLSELVAALGAGQVLLHLVFMAGSGEHTGGVGMLAAHAVATIVLALVLARAERAAWNLWCWLRPRMGLPRIDPEEPPQRADPPADTSVARARLTWVGTSVMWRGPPTA